MSAPGTFSYVSAPPTVPVSHPKQQYFLPLNEKNLYGVRASGDQAGEVLAYRNADLDSADLTMKISFRCQISVTLTATELREVARLCLNAANDLENFPAAVLALASVAPEIAGAES